VSRVRLSLSHRDSEGSPSCVLGLLLTLSSNLVAIFIGWVVSSFLSLDGFCFSSGRYPLPGRRFRLDSDCPDEAQQFAPQRGDDLSLVLAGRRQPAVALVQSVLCLPGYLLDLLWNALLSLPQRWSDAWWKPIASGCFNGDPSQMRVAGLGDTSALFSLATGILARHHATVAH
jgi:hypothetical protein